MQYKRVIIFCFIITTTGASSNRNFSQRWIWWLQTKWRLKVRRFFMKIWAFDPKNCQKMLFLALFSPNIDFSWKLGVKPEPLRHSGGSLRKKIFHAKNCGNEPIYWCCALRMLHPGSNGPHPWRLLPKWHLWPIKRLKHPNLFFFWNTPIRHLQPMAFLVLHLRFA